MSKTKKSLVMYQSQTGNTEKVAMRFKEVFEKRGWQCDMLKITKKTDIYKPPDFLAYDFICVGSGVYKQLPPEQIVDIMFFVSHPRRGNPDEAPRTISRVETRIIPGPKTGIVFATYGGLHLGPKEAEPTLSLLELELEHLKFKCVGRFCCLGKFGDIPHLLNKPDERDLLKAEIFLEDRLQELEELEEVEKLNK